MPSDFRLPPRQRRLLRQQLKHVTDVRVYKRAVALLALDRGQPVHQVAALLQVHRATVDNWRKRYVQMPKPQSLADRPGRGRRSLLEPSLTQQLVEAMAHRPVSLGYMATEWTVPLLIEPLHRVGGLRLSEDTLRRQLHRMGYRYKRPRYVLVPDPLYEKKARNTAASASSAARHGRAP